MFKPTNSQLSSLRQTFFLDTAIWEFKFTSKNPISKNSAIFIKEKQIGLSLMTFDETVF